MLNIECKSENAEISRICSSQTFEGNNEIQISAASTPTTRVLRTLCPRFHGTVWDDQQQGYLRLEVGCPLFSFYVIGNNFQN